MNIELPRNAELIIDKLTDAGYEAYAVGGFVRDKLMGREVSDIDITTSAVPEETKKVFADYIVIETGIKHGTVTLLIDNVPYEITTYRCESGYTDSRHPDEVAFVRDINIDLSRRDFTVNAIAYSHQNGIVDLFGGTNDIDNKIIRAVGDPYKRFGEDALRILRALRFASVLGFEIEPKTSSAIFELCYTLNKVSPERIFAELKKLLCGINAENVLKKYMVCLERIIPIKGGFERISLLPDDFPMRLTCLCGSAVTAALKYLRADNRTKQICAALSSSAPIPNDETELKLYISSLGRETAKTVLDYRRILFGEDEDHQGERIIASNICLSVSELAINGNDLLKHGIKGTDIGRIIKQLLYSVITNETENNKKALLKKAMALM